MFIATEMDTWEYMGGTSFFNRAIELSDLGKDSDWPNGWDDRWKKARKIKNNQYLRSMRFNFFVAMDALKAEKVDINLVKTSMSTLYEDLKSIDEKLGSNKETLKFLDTYHISIADLRPRSRQLCNIYIPKNKYYNDDDDDDDKNNIDEKNKNVDAFINDYILINSDYEREFNLTLSNDMNKSERIKIKTQRQTN